jgi:Alr-MurF fusion protein
MADYSIKELAEACKGVLYATSDEIIIRHLITDSRKFSFPGDSVFFAIIGERNDGHKFLDNLYHQHVRNFIVSRLPVDKEKFPGANFILVGDTLLALQQVAAMHRNTFKLPVIGITGSNGKTILKEWLYQLLYKDKSIVRSPKAIIPRSESLCQSGN